MKFDTLEWITITANNPSCYHVYIYIYIYIYVCVCVCVCVSFPFFLFCLSFLRLLPLFIFYLNVRKNTFWWSFSWNKDEILLLSKVATVVEGEPEGSLFNSYYTEVLGRALRLPLDTYLIRLGLSKEVSSIIFWIFRMTCPVITPR